MLVHAQINALQTTVYASVIQVRKIRGLLLTEDEREAPWRIFDRVTRETTLETIISDGRTIQNFILTETKSIAAVMDPINPSKTAKGKKLIFMTSNQIPESSLVLPAVVRYAFNMVDVDLLPLVR